MKATKLYVVRHGQTAHNRDDIVSGQVDPPLTKQGEKQAEGAKIKLANVHFDEVYSSDLKRAVQTAEIIFGKSVPSEHQLAQLRERDFGKIEGKPGQHLRRLREGQQEIYDSLPHDKRWEFKHAPDMESDYELSLRFVKALKKIASENIGKTMLVVAHGGTLRTMLIKLGHSTLDDLPPDSVSNAAFVELNYDGKILKVNKTTGVTKI